MSELEPNSDPDPRAITLAMILGACALGVIAILTLVKASEWWEIVTGIIAAVVAVMLFYRGIRLRSQRPTSSPDR